jgi:hypothetical protein
VQHRGIQLLAVKVSPVHDADGRRLAAVHPLLAAADQPRTRAGLRGHRHRRGERGGIDAAIALDAKLDLGDEALGNTEPPPLVG